jgi:hypothetical protein
MNKMMLGLALASAVATPAHATGGMICRTSGGGPLIVSLGFGHVPGSPLILTRLTDSGRQVPVQSAQWWLDNRELRVVLISPDAMREELTLRVRRNGHVYDGSAVRNGRRRWVRCRED